MGHIWEHIFLLIRCPFLALSATISNIETLRDWLQTAEQVKPTDGTTARPVEMITYDERWSELELALQHIRVNIIKCRKKNKFFRIVQRDFNSKTKRSNCFAVDRLHPTTRMRTNQRKVQLNPVDKRHWQRRNQHNRLSFNKFNKCQFPAMLEEHFHRRAVMFQKDQGFHFLFNFNKFNFFRASWHDVIQHFNPFAVYKLEKLRMFGIPADQRLTARQVLDLYEMMTSVDSQVKYECI